MEKFLEAVLTPGFGLTLAGIVVFGMILNHIRQMALIRSGLIKKPAARVWRIDYEKLRSGLWLAALGGVIAAALHFEQITGWVAFWLLIALLGIGQVLASLLGRERWTKNRFRRYYHHN